MHRATLLTAFLLTVLFLSLSLFASPVDSFFSWELEDVCGLDDVDCPASEWSNVPALTDVSAVYCRVSGSSLEIRVDFLRLAASQLSDLVLEIKLWTRASDESTSYRIDFPSGTTSGRAEGGVGLESIQVDTALDAISVSIRAVDLRNFGFAPDELARIQVAASSKSDASIADEAGPFNVNARLSALPFAYGVFMSTGGSSMGMTGSDRWLPDWGNGERGFLPVLQIAERYDFPVNSLLGQGVLIQADYLGHTDYLRSLIDAGVLELMGSAFEDIAITWQSQEAVGEGIWQYKELCRALNLPIGPAFFPNCAAITRSDFDLIRNAGYSILAGGWLNNWLPDTLKGEHGADQLYAINGLVTAFTQHGEGHIRGVSDYPAFDTRRALVRGALEFNRSGENVYVNLEDGWRFSGMEAGNSSSGVADWEEFVSWIASRPWVEPLTLSELATRVTAKVVPDLDPLKDFIGVEGSRSYWEYYPLNYHGGISDGHSPIVAEGEQIESFSDFVPVISNGTTIPSGLAMGDYLQAGTIVHDLMRKIGQIPFESLRSLAWYSYLMCTRHQEERESGFGTIGGPLLPAYAKTGATWMRAIGKIVAASDWAVSVQSGALVGQANALQQDIDYDGELEYILSNERVFAVFENDGGRVDFLFSFDASRGAIPLIFPATLLNSARDSRSDYYGESASLEVYWNWQLLPFDQGFVDIGLQRGIYSVEVFADSVIMTSPNDQIRKRFTISPGAPSIEIEYELEQDREIMIGLCVNPYSLFSGNLSEKWSIDHNQHYIKVENSDAGFVSVIVQGDARIIGVDSFDEAPGHFIPYATCHVESPNSFEAEICVDQERFSELMTESTASTASPIPVIVGDVHSASHTRGDVSGNPHLSIEFIPEEMDEATGVSALHYYWGLAVEEGGVRMMEQAAQLSRSWRSGEFTAAEAGFWMFDLWGVDKAGVRITDWMRFDFWYEEGSEDP